MNVNLLSYTQSALELLLYTKNTRLQGAQSLSDIYGWAMDEKLEELAYMRDTIQSSWEFVDYTFEISGVTRAFTHQLVRTRTGNYAQESQRTVDVRDHQVMGPGHEAFDEAVGHARAAYAVMVDDGIPVQDARAILPTGVTTSIIAKFSLRTLHDMALLRLCYRTQGEYQEVFRLMRSKVIEVHPWAENFIKVHCAWHGSCAFPRYTECPIQWLVDPNLTKGRTDDAQHAWNSLPGHEAVPVAKDGRTM